MVTVRGQDSRNVTEPILLLVQEVVAKLQEGARNEWLRQAGESVRSPVPTRAASDWRETLPLQRLVHRRRVLGTSGRGNRRPNTSRQAARGLPGPVGAARRERPFLPASDGAAVPRRGPRCWSAVC